MSQQGYTDQITRLIEQEGAARARAAAEKGQIIGGALANLGQIPAQVAQLDRVRQQGELQKQQGQLVGLELQQRKQQMADEAATRTALSESGGDLEKALPAIMRTNPEAGLKLQDALRKQKQAVLEFHTAVAGHIAAAVGPIADAKDPASQQAAIDHAHAQLQAMGIPTDDLPKQAGPAATAIATAFRKSAMSAKDQLAANAQETTAAARAKAAEATATEAAARLPGIRADTTVKEQVAAGTVGGITPEQKAQNDARAATEKRETEQGNARIGLERQRVALEQNKAKQAEADKTELTPEGLDAAAMMFAKTGQLPALGMGDKTTRKAIINRAAAMVPGLDIAVAKADFDANKSTLTKLQNQRATIGAFEKTAQKNIDLFLEQAGKVVDTGSPLANTFIRAASGKILGSPDQAAFDAARQVAINEIAKVTQGGGLSGVLSDSARHEIAAFNPANATLKQTVAVVRLLKQDMANRTAGLDEQIDAIKSRLSGKSESSSDGDTIKVGGFTVKVKK